MKASEISVGDYVKALNYYDDGSSHIGQVDGIIKKHGTYYCVFGVREITVEVDKCEPIELTREILEKNEFVEQKSSGIFYAYDTEDDADQQVEIMLFHVESPFDANARLLIKYQLGDESTLFRGVCNCVHELQRALDLCCIRRKIEL